MFAPSRAALSAIALPIPLLAPVINNVRPQRLLREYISLALTLRFFHSTYMVGPKMVGRKQQYRLIISIYTPPHYTPIFGALAHYVINY